MRSKNSILFLLTLCLVFASACQRRVAATEPTKMNPQFTVAVAPFTVAHENWDLLTGYMPDKVTSPKADALIDLDDALFKAMHVTPERNVIAGAKAKSCVDSVHRSPDQSRTTTLKYWQEVGKCLDAQYLLVPIVVNWKEREGSAVGSTSPAWVILDLYLINVKTGGLVNHFHYDYQQQPLTDNILDMDKFLKRRGQWVTATDLAREGMEKGLKELGL
jgi:hypothetical protein